MEERFDLSAHLPALGERVLLRRPAPEDEAEFLALRRASREFHAPWEPAPRPGSDPCSADAFREYVATADEPRRQRFLVCRRGDGAIVGALHLSEIVRGPFRSAYLSYWCGAPFARRGYLREGLSLLLDLAFGPLGLHRLEANLIPSNVPSRALVRGAGFRQEGYSPRYLEIAGGWRDHERWALLAEDHAARRATRDAGAARSRPPCGAEGLTPP